MSKNKSVEPVARREEIKTYIFKTIDNPIELKIIFLGCGTGIAYAIKEWERLSELESDDEQSG